jgi:hypothetical protein
MSMGASAVWRANQSGRSRAIGPSDPMPFGKYQGTPIDQVERSYLYWLRDKSDRCNPLAENYWPELREAILSLIGDSDAPPRKPVLALPALCALLNSRGVRIASKAGEIVTSEEVTDEELLDALRVHKVTLLHLIAIIDPRCLSGNGSAKYLWAADLRCRIKSWFGQMSRQFHPDMGGSTDGQVAVNTCFKTLMETFTEWEATP